MECGENGNSEAVFIAREDGNQLLSSCLGLKKGDLILLLQIELNSTEIASGTDQD